MTFYTTTGTNDRWQLERMRQTITNNNQIHYPETYLGSRLANVLIQFERGGRVNHTDILLLCANYCIKK